MSAQVLDGLQHPVHQPSQCVPGVGHRAALLQPAHRTPLHVRVLSVHAEDVQQASVRGLGAHRVYDGEGELSLGDVFAVGLGPSIAVAGKDM